MDLEINEAILEVLNAPHMGGVSTSYTVFHTAERVMLVFGLLPGQHRDALKSLIAAQTNNHWEEDPELERITGAKLVLGLPESIVSVKKRLKEADAIAKQKEP